MHVVAHVDPRNGLPVSAASPACPKETLRDAVFEVFPPLYATWAANAHRPVLPAEESPLCGSRAMGGVVRGGDVRIEYPAEGATFAIDPARPSNSQAVSVRVDARGAPTVVLRVDGRVVDQRPRGQELVWRLTPGTHVLVAETGTGKSQARTVHVH